ncbi:ATP-binding protein [Paenibacillus donghaensis]|uniref:Sensor histidine kinase NatK-like C-terminal domain-containing protein n=1 Tax=Paenibacillus donghaensis TaxID=414771 RepID=A0A2Z2KLB0_9BACL|nr:ATP-binding protein [Paenibacillus donghaensis]ASA20741.1 hypothetical protein B9T62_08045 [Paenibacillus donghaensis]
MNIEGEQHKYVTYLFITSLLNLLSAFLIASLYPSRLEARAIYSVIHLVLGFTAEIISYYMITRNAIIKKREAIQHIHNMFERIESSYKRVNTGNLVIDALVSNALRPAYEHNIESKHSINISAEDITMEGYDLCVILGNMLENVIESASAVPPGTNRSIEIYIISNHHSLMLQVMNTYQKPCGPVKKTLKKDPEFHGIGLLNIQKTAEKYGGHLKLNATDNQFETSVVLPL